MHIQIENTALGGLGIDGQAALIGEQAVQPQRHVLSQKTGVHRGARCCNQGQIIGGRTGLIIIVTDSQQLMATQAITDIAGFTACHKTIPGTGAHGLQQQFLIGAGTNGNHGYPGASTGQGSDNRQ